MIDVFGILYTPEVLMILWQSDFSALFFFLTDFNLLKQTNLEVLGCHLTLLSQQCCKRLWGKMESMKGN